MSNFLFSNWKNPGYAIHLVEQMRKRLFPTFLVLRSLFLGWQPELKNNDISFAHQAWIKLLILTKNDSEPNKRSANNGEE